MIFYGGKNKDSYQVLKAEPAKKFDVYSVKNTWWWKFVRIFLQIIISVLTAIIARMVDGILPGLGVAIEFGVNTLTDLIFNLIENDGKIDWVDFGISAGFNSASAISRGFKVFKALRTQNKVLSLADNIVAKNTEFKNQFKQTAKTIAEFGAKGDTLKIANYKSIKNTTSAILETVNNSENIFKHTFVESKQIFNRTKKILDGATKVFTKIRVFISLLTSPRFAAKKAVDFAIKIPRRKIVKTFNNFASDKIKKIFYKGRKTLKESLRSIPLNSSWIDSITILQTNSPWDLKNLNAVIKFNKNATNNKKPVVLWQKDSKLIFDFLTTSSPGAHYLKYFAWGWDIGKILRKYNSFITLTTIPLFSNLINTLASSYRTINAIHQSLQEEKWLWNKNKKSLIEEFKKGAQEGLLKGWNFKYIRPAVSFGRSIIEKRPNYVIQSFAKGTRKAFFYHSAYQKLKKYTYKKHRGRRKWK
ncbi:hypothetical protein ACT1UH_02935 [Mycoplasma sp. 332]|uniref:hypothetical protein n=1 Tax=Mycoplasma sp. 332 TaxID=3458236 RepID=UPI0040362DF8